MEVILGLDLIAMALVFGYCFAVQPRYATPGARRVADWSLAQPLLVRVLLGYAVWVVWMSGIYFVAQGT